MAAPIEKGIVLGLVTVVVVIICGAVLNDRLEDPAPQGPYFEVEDCDADDRSPHWQVSECGPSPKPMQTANQPKPTRSRR